MKKFIVFILFFAFITLGCSTVFAENENKKSKPKKTYTEREYITETKDNKLIYAYLSYPKTNLKGYPTIILLHSIGRNSKYWQPLQEEFNNSGYAVLRIDFRGHGKSVFDKKFRQKSWTAYSNSSFLKYPQDVIDVINKIQKATKKANFNNYLIIGSDIGANTAVLVAKSLQVKPKGLVLIAPSMNFKGLYIPVALTEIGTTPILAISSKTNKYFMEEQTKLSKFAQGDFDIYNTENGGADMLLLKQHPEVQKTIVNWVKSYLK